jgi:hypothetical protein
MPNAGVYSIAYTMTTLSHTQKTKNQMRRIEFMEHKTQISCSIYFHSTRNLYYLNKQICLNNNNTNNNNNNNNNSNNNNNNDLVLSTS